MYMLFFAAFVLMVLTVFSSTESGGDRADARPDDATGGLVKSSSRREYLLIVLMLIGAGVVALVGLYLRKG